MNSDLSVLIIDDSQIIQRATKLILQKAGFDDKKLVSVSNSSDAVKECESQNYDVLLIDYNLGSGSNGLKLLERLYKQSLMRHRPIVFIVTAEDSASVFMGFNEYSPYDYLIKPLRMKMLVERLILSLEQKKSLERIIASYHMDGLETAEFIINTSSEVRSKKSLVWRFVEYLIEENKYDDAYYLSSQLTLSLEYLPLLFSKANIEFSRGQLELAKKTLNKIFKKRDNHIKSLDLRGEIDFINNDVISAYSYLSKSYRLNSANKVNLIKLVWMEMLHIRSESIDRYLKELCLCRGEINYSNESIFLLIVCSALTITMNANNSDATIELYRKKIHFQSNELYKSVLIDAWLEYSKGDLIKSYIAIDSIDVETLTSHERVIYGFLLYSIGMYPDALITFKKLENDHTLQNDVASQTIYSLIHIAISQIDSTALIKQSDIDRLIKTKKYVMASKVLFEQWRYNKFDLKFCREIIELYVNKLIVIDKDKLKVVLFVKDYLDQVKDTPYWYDDIKSKSNLLVKDFFKKSL
ncbi:response regulator [Vibrio kasasachensis]|uniref:response regulator n=1 Tax=Vibrio kasasachensis TaxID=2910248 RepID=UPI003D116721